MGRADPLATRRVRYAPRRCPFGRGSAPGRWSGALRRPRRRGSPLPMSRAPRMSPRRGNTSSERAPATSRAPIARPSPSSSWRMRSIRAPRISSSTSGWCTKSSPTSTRRSSGSACIRRWISCLRSASARTRTFGASRAPSGRWRRSRQPHRSRHPSPRRRRPSQAHPATRSRPLPIHRRRPP